MSRILEVPAGHEQLPEIAEFIQEKAHEEKIPSRRMWELLLVVDELVSSILQHCANPDETLSLSWDFSEERVTLILSVTGLPYNPLSSQGSGEHKTGSLEEPGLSLVQKMVSDISYHREENQNIFTIQKALRKKTKKKQAKKNT